MDLHELSELASLSLTIPAVLLMVAVVCVWGPSVLNAFKGRKHFDAQEWFILGVFVSFLGSIVDNMFWVIPWSADYLGATATEVYGLFYEGVYVNIIFRQSAGLFAAWCHLHAAALSDPGKKRLINQLLAFGYVSAAITAGVLLYLK